MIKLYKGDKVRVTCDKGNYFNKGDEVEYVGGMDFKIESGLTQMLQSNQYELIKTNRFKVGDKVKLAVTEPTSEHFSLTTDMLECKSPMTVSNIRKSYDNKTLITVEENYYNYHPSWLKLYDDEELEDDEMEELKVGDIVKVVDLNSGHQFKIGELAELIGLESDGQHRFKSTTRGERWFMRSSEYKKVDKSEMGDECVDKVGDKFVVINDEVRNFDFGEIVELIIFESDEIHLYGSLNGDRHKWYIPREKLIKIKNYEDLINPKVTGTAVDASDMISTIQPLVDVRESLMSGGFTGEEALSIILKIIENSK